MNDGDSDFVAVTMSLMEDVVDTFGWSDLRVRRGENLESNTTNA
jgi:hypothetical protein